MALPGKAVLSRFALFGRFVPQGRPDRSPRNSHVDGLALIGSLRTRLPVAAKIVTTNITGRDGSRAIGDAGPVKIELAGRA